MSELDAELFKFLFAIVDGQRDNDFIQKTATFLYVRSRTRQPARIDRAAHFAVLQYNKMYSALDVTWCVYDDLVGTEPGCAESYLQPISSSRRRSQGLPIRSQVHREAPATSERSLTQYVTRNSEYISVSRHR